MRSTYRLTVSQDLYDATCAETDQPFADSYLFGSEQRGDRLFPRTVTGYLKMRDSRGFMQLLGHLKMTLIRPDPFPGGGDRMTHEQCR